MSPAPDKNRAPERSPPQTTLFHRYLVAKRPTNRDSSPPAEDGNTDASPAAKRTFHFKSEDINTLLDAETPWRDPSNEKLFPRKPEGVDYGVLLAVEEGSATTSLEKCKSINEVIKHIDESPDAVQSVFLPDVDQGVPWQTLPLVEFADREASKKNFLNSLQSSALLGVGLIVFGFLYPSSYAAYAIIFGIMMVLPTIDHLLQWLTFPKALSGEESQRRGQDHMLFRRWLKLKKTRFLPVIGFLIVLIGIFLLQDYGKYAQRYGTDYVSASLIRSRVIENGEWWRLLTAGVLHGSYLHLFFNGSALYSLGKLLVSLSNLRTLIIVFVFSVLGGTLLSLGLSTSDRPSLGASGGILGCLGYLAALCLRFRQTIPNDFTAMVLRNIGLLSVMGIIGIQFIDNAAHAGGLLTGFFFAFVIGPPREKWWAHKPNDAITGLALFCLIVLACTIFKAVQVML